LLPALKQKSCGHKFKVGREKEIVETRWLTTENTYVQGGSNMTGTDLCVNKPHCAVAVRP